MPCKTQAAGSRFTTRKRTYAPILAVVLAISASFPRMAAAQIENIVYSFQNGSADGHTPYAGVIRDSAGNLYGTTAYGGALNQGAVYKISKHARTILQGDYSPQLWPIDGRWKISQCGPHPGCKGHFIWHHCAGRTS